MILTQNNKAMAFARKYVGEGSFFLDRGNLRYPHQCAHFYYVNYRHTIRGCYAGSLPPESCK